MSSDQPRENKARLSEDVAALRESEERYRNLFYATQTPYLVLATDAPRFTITDVNGAYLRATMTEYDRLVGRGISDAFPDNPDDPDATGVGNLKVSLERALATREPDAMAVQKYDIRRADGSFEERHWSPVNTPILDREGRPVGILHHVEDVSDYILLRTQGIERDRKAERLRAEVVAAGNRLQRANESLRESESRLRHIIESATEYAIVTLDPERRIESWNSGAERLLGFAEAEALGQTADIFFTDEDRAAGEPEREMQIARDEGRAANERWHMRKDGTRFWGSGVMLPIENERQGYSIKIFRDRTEERRARERQQLLINELNHRVKNTLATVQAIASQTFRSGTADNDARQSFEVRLRALASAHDVLTQECWEGADLRQIARAALRPFQIRGEERLGIDGPGIYLSPKAALALAMTLHELATNAVKHGALSNEAGRVDVSWAVTGDTEPHLHFRWQERGGPAVAAPESKGFGSRLIERSLARNLGAEVSVDYAAGGVVCTIDALVAKLREGAANLE